MLPCVLLLYVVHGVAWWVALFGAGINLGLIKAIEITYISQALATWRRRSSMTTSSTSSS